MAVLFFRGVQGMAVLFFRGVQGRYVVRFQVSLAESYSELTFALALKICEVSKFAASITNLHFHSVDGY